LLRLEDRKGGEDGERGNMTKKWDNDKIVFGGGVQEKMIVFVYCLVMVDKKKNIKKIILLLIYIVVKLTYWKK